MLTKKTLAGAPGARVRKGRPRAFEMADALGVAESMFHHHGFDAVSVQQLADAMDIRPSSFYAAFGSKLVLFERVLSRYQESGSLDVAGILASAEPGSGLQAILDQAAVLYSKRPDRPGCMALQAETSADDSVRALANDVASSVRHLMRRYAVSCGVRDPDASVRYVQMCLRALSLEARRGATQRELRSLAAMAGAGVAA